MEHIESQNKERFIVAAAALLVFASLPLLALLAFALRAMLLLAAATALVVGLAAYAACPKFREWFNVRSRPQVDYRGLHLARDVSLHPGHGWARMEGDAWVGADDVVQAVLGPVEAVELPPEGLSVVQGERLFRLRRGDRAVEVPSPISGTVLACNPALRGHPELVNEDPFGRGWAVRLRSENLHRDRPVLLRGRRARAWFVSTADSILALWPEGAESAAPTDERVATRLLHRHIADAAWGELSQTMFTFRPAAGAGV